MFLPILISTTLFLTPVWTSRTFDFSWGSAGENYEYVFEVYTDRELTNLYMALPPTTNTYVNPVYHDTGLFFQRIKYYPISSPNDFSYSYLGQFYLNLEKGIVSEDIPYFPRRRGRAGRKSDRRGNRYFAPTTRRRGAH